MKINELMLCSGCHACASICPKQCITMTSDCEGFLYPKIDSSKCVDCHLCEEACPILNPVSIKKERTTEAYAAHNKNEKVRLKSSSGGIFTLLAEYVIAHKGVVFGAGFNDKFEVAHLGVETLEGLEQLRGSKYVQSRMGDAYQQAQTFLEKGRLVLFTGTPCQIGGLLSFLRKEYENLITQDIICHGVPSPMVWQKYIAYREKYAGSNAKKIAFRQKNEGWKLYSVSFLFNNDTEYHQTFDKDLMMTAFLQNICLRPSCYDCSYKMLHRESDITLADFWGVENILPEMDDDKGISLLIINSPKGQAIFNSIQEHMIYIKTDLNEAIKYNSAMIKSVAMNKNRMNFLKDIVTLEFNKAVKKYCSNSIIVKLKSIVYRVLSKIKKCI